MKNISKTALIAAMFASGTAFADPIIATKGYVDGGLATKASASDLAAKADTASLGTAAYENVGAFDAAGTAAAAVAAAAGNYATAAQGALADSALQAGDNVSDLVNDAGYITSANVSNKADKIVPGSAGNLAGLDGGGNLTDSGVAAGDVASAAAVNSALAGKQDNIGGGTAGTVITNTGVAGTVGALDVDGVVAGGSNNLITSGAVHAAIGAIDTTAKADKVVSAVAGNLAELDGGGNLVDSGVAAIDVATTADLAAKQDALSAANNKILWANDTTGALTWVSLTGDTYP